MCFHLYHLKLFGSVKAHPKADTANRVRLYKKGFIVRVRRYEDDRQGRRYSEAMLDGRAELSRMVVSKVEPSKKGRRGSEAG